ncbi:hypothetical protein [Winslowiella arboricola]|uniref:hypothetical protein n=1 Tax=Winslowiella arboricola TaxID=2978220 RepID=UPI00225E38A9|nr:hypothetical protein [Winslowiella arboricola]MCU5775245.1 hypothetical protein [Winslowiella arboricola]
MVDNFFQYRYGWEKLHGAVHSLCGVGSLKERLENAYLYNLLHLTVENDIPEPVRGRFNELSQSLTRGRPEGEEGRVHATIIAMDDAELNAAVSEIIGLYDDLCRYMPIHHQ